MYMFWNNVIFLSFVNQFGDIIFFNPMMIQLYKLLLNNLIEKIKYDLEHYHSSDIVIIKYIINVIIFHIIYSNYYITNILPFILILTTKNRVICVLFGVGILNNNIFKNIIIAYISGITENYLYNKPEILSSSINIRKTYFKRNKKNKKENKRNISGSTLEYLNPVVPEIKDSLLDEYLHPDKS